MAKTARPHSLSTLGWGCAIEAYSADVADAFPASSAELAGSDNPRLSDPDTKACFRDAGRRAQDDQAWWGYVINEEAKAAGAPPEWLATADGQNFISAQAGRVAWVTAAAKSLQERLAKPRKARDYENPPRSIVVDVIAGAFFLARGDMAEAARLLNQGIPTFARVEGVTPSEVRNAVSTFRTTRLPRDASPIAITAAVVLATDLAVRFQAKTDLLAELKSRPEFRTAPPPAIFLALIDDGRLLDLHHGAIERARSPALAARASQGLLSIARAQFKALDRVRMRRGLAA